MEQEMFVLSYTEGLLVLSLLIRNTGVFVLSPQLSLAAKMRFSSPWKSTGAFVIVRLQGMRLFLHPRLP